MADVLKRIKLIWYAITLGNDELNEVMDFIPEVIEFWQCRRAYNPPPVKDPETYTVTVGDTVIRDGFTIDTDEW